MLNINQTNKTPVARNRAKSKQLINKTSQSADVEKIKEINTPVDSQQNKPDKKRVKRKPGLAKNKSSSTESLEDSVYDKSGKSSSMSSVDFTV